MNTQTYSNELNILEQHKVNGGLEAINSMQSYNNGTVSAMNFVHFKSSDRNTTVNQLNISQGSFIHIPYNNSSNTLTQVNTISSDILLIEQEF
ncbi:MAG: hypothetical protein AAFX80_14655 [Cyanobacteria bacterium J06639_18]